jgi:outer membrane protein insertion porin family
VLNRYSLLLVFSFYICLSIAQVQSIRISSVTVKGNISADASTIRLNSGLIPGKEITIDDLQEAVKNLWNLQVFSDIKIYILNQTAEGIDIQIEVEEYPRLKKMELSGNKEIDTDDIEKEISVYRGMVLSDYKINKIHSSIENLYKKEGYLLAKIRIDKIPVDSLKMNLQIDIEEGEKVQVEKINFHDNEDIDDDDLRGAMDDIREDRWWRSADFDQKKYEADLDRIIEYYREKGYRDAEIIRDSISYSDDKKDMFIDIWVYEGNKYYYGDITFSGNTIFSNDALLYELDIKKGEEYNQKEFDKAVRERLQKLYWNQGYLFANIQPQEVSKGKDTLNINFSITEGHVVHVKEINIVGNTKTHEKVIRREFKLNPGDVFNSAKLERSVQGIHMLNYFSNIIPDVQMIENDDKNINLEVKVEEKSTDMANMSAGYSQRDGMIGSVGLTFNNYSLSHPFSGGDGQRLVFDWQFGKYYRSISVSFTEPWLFNTPTLGGFSIFNTRWGGNYYNYNSHRTGGTIHIGRRFYWPDNFFRGDWILGYTKTTYTDISPSLLAVWGDNEYQDIVQISLTQIISRDSRDQPEFPTRGSDHSLSIELSGGPLGGKSHYVKTIFNSDWYMSLPFRFVLCSKNMYGFLKTLKENSSILFNEYFYLGGSGLTYSEPLRGYDDAKVGPLTYDGYPIGGRSIVRNTFELRFPIVPNPTIFGLFFMEAGNCWRDISETDPFDLRRSAGAGLRLFMPMIGIIGIDFGYGFDHFNAEGERKGDWKIHFQFGRF